MDVDSEGLRIIFWIREFDGFVFLAKCCPFWLENFAEEVGGSAEYGSVDLENFGCLSYCYTDGGTCKPDGRTGQRRQRELNRIVI